MWGLSSVGRAPALQAGCRRFDPVRLHQTPPWRLLWEGAGHRIATHSIAVEVIIKEESKSLRSDQPSGRIASERHMFLPALRGSQFRCEDT